MTGTTQVNKIGIPRVILCDLDGVIWLSHKPIAGSVEAIARLHILGVQVLFVTNNSATPTPEVEELLDDIGINAAGSVLTSAQAVARLIRPSERVLVCGGAGLIGQISAIADVVVGHHEAEPTGIFDAVVVGFHREFSYEVLRRAAQAINSGARFIASNDDATYPTPDGPIPGGGAIVAAISAACGQSAEVAGKPNSAMADLVWSRCGDVKPDQMLMVGDRQSTDGKFARLLGCRFALVLSGVTAKSNNSDADFIGDTLSDIVKQIETQ